MCRCAPGLVSVADSECPEIFAESAIDAPRMRACTTGRWYAMLIGGHLLPPPLLEAWMRFIFALLFTLFTVPVAAQTDVVAGLVEELKADGYVVLDQRGTLLGRTQIVVRRDDEIREIVINPNSGEILRDLSRPATAEDDTSASDAD